MVNDKFVEVLLNIFSSIVNGKLTLFFREVSYENDNSNNANNSGISKHTTVRVWNRRIGKRANKNV